MPEGESAREGGVSKKLGCIFCRSGSEDALVQALRRVHPELEALSPRRVRIRRSGGKAVAETAPLFPGYIFFRTADEPDFRTFVRQKHLYRLLTYSGGDWVLHGADRAVASLMFEHRGVIGLSKAFYVGDAIRVTEGAMKGREAAIVKFNRRAMTAQVKLDFMGKTLCLWLGYELIDPVTTE